MLAVGNKFPEKVACVDWNSATLASPCTLTDTFPPGEEIFTEEFPLVIMLDGAGTIPVNCEPLPRIYPPEILPLAHTSFQRLPVDPMLYKLVAAGIIFPAKSV